MEKRAAATFSRSRGRNRRRSTRKEERKYGQTGGKFHEHMDCCLKNTKVPFSQNLGLEVSVND